MKRPAFQFYPGDWQRDSALRACSLGARGLWIELMCVMHQADPYGHLVLNGRTIDVEQLGRMVGAKEREVKRWLGELAAAGVYSTDPEGRIFSRRMVKDEYIRGIRAAAGEKGGNPDLLKQRDNQKPEGKVNQADKQIPTPSSSSSSSSSEKKKDTVGLKPDAKSARLAQAKIVLEYLNAATKAEYHFVPANLDPIAARLATSSVEEAKRVIDAKVLEWGNTEFAKHLTPKTLFRAQNFEGYRGRLGAPSILDPVLADLRDRYGNSVEKVGNNYTIPGSGRKWDRNGNGMVDI